MWGIPEGFKYVVGVYPFDCGKCYSFIVKINNHTTNSEKETIKGQLGSAVGFTFIDFVEPPWGLYKPAKRRLINHIEEYGLHIAACMRDGYSSKAAIENANESYMEEIEGMIDESN